MRKLLALFAMLGVILSVAVSAPAQAKTIFPSVYGCPNNSTNKGALCLYQWADYNSSGGVWKRALTDLGDSNDGGVSGCTNLNDMHWDGTSNPVYDTTSSILMNTSAPANYVILFYEWTNCNGAGRHFYCNVPNTIPWVYGQQNLLAVAPSSQGGYPCRTGNENRNFQNTIASIRIID